MSVPFSPVVLTSDQDNALMKRKVHINGKWKLWKLKSSQPHLFAHHDQLYPAAGSATAAAGSSHMSEMPGFEQVGDGWFFHRERQVYVEFASQRALWFDAACGVYREHAVGEDATAELALAGAAATSSSSRAPAGKAPAAAAAAAAAAGPAARHLVILDLHKVADVLKLELGHIDRPAAMLAVYRHADGAVPPEAAAKGLHEKLLRRLVAFRGAWSDEALQAALVEGLSSAAAEQRAPGGVAGVVVLVLGQRLVAAASHGAACAIADPLPGDMKDVRLVVASTGGPGLQAACERLEPQSAACVLLHTERLDEQAARRAAGHAERGHPRAAAVALLQAPPGEALGAGPAAAGSHAVPAAGRQAASPAAPAAASAAAAAPRGRAAACLHLAWRDADEAAAEEGPAAKRPRPGDARAGGGGEQKVRCRQILLKFVGCNKATDVRRRPVQRSLPEAEALALDVLARLEEARAQGGAAAAEAAFTKQVRAVSECQSSLKGGDLAGDVGWLRLPEIKPGEKVTKEQSQRMLVIRAALGLAVHEVSDLVVNDDGVHILKRAA